MRHGSIATAKDLDISELFNTKMFHNKKIAQMAKTLHTMKDTASFAEDNSDLAIDSRVT